MEGSKEAKRAAAVAAVYSYLAQRAAAGGAAEVRQTAGQTGPSLWALYGRQALMNQRIRMQARRRT
jgi:hypothetical protein